MEKIYTCHSEYGHLETVFVKKIQDAFVDEASIKEHGKNSII